MLNSTLTLYISVFVFHYHIICCGALAERVILWPNATVTVSESHCRGPTSIQLNFTASNVGHVSFLFATQTQCKCLARAHDSKCDYIGPLSILNQHNGTARLDANVLSNDYCLLVRNENTVNVTVTYDLVLACGSDVSNALAFGLFFLVVCVLIVCSCGVFWKRPGPNNRDTERTFQALCC